MAKLKIGTYEAEIVDTAARASISTEASTRASEYSKLKSELIAADAALKSDIEALKRDEVVEKLDSDLTVGRVTLTNQNITIDSTNQKFCNGFVELQANKEYTFYVASGFKFFGAMVNGDTLTSNVYAAPFGGAWKTGQTEITVTTTGVWHMARYSVFRTDNGNITETDLENAVSISSTSDSIFATKESVAEIEGDIIGLDESIDDAEEHIENIKASLVPLRPHSVLMYEGDSKVTDGHIVNAVAYDDGTVIACRSNGKIVKITQRYGETTLLALSGASNIDWRGLYMASNGDVYASPHATNGTLAYSDRGLYKLSNGGAAFTKVLSLSVDAEYDDTIWTMCQDKNGYLYAGVYAHTKHSNPKIYKSIDGGNTWVDRYTFASGNHIHAICYSQWQNALYCIVGELNTVYKSTDGGENWTDLNVKLTIKGSAMLPTKNGLIIGSDNAYFCDIDILRNDDTTHDKVFRGWANTVFAIRQSDKTGWIYAFTKIDSSVNLPAYFPPKATAEKPTRSEQWSDISTWKASASSTTWCEWYQYNQAVCDTYPDDSIIPMHYGILISRDGGETWEVLKRWKVWETGKAFGFYTIGYFRNGECLAGRWNENGYDAPIIISEGKHNFVDYGAYIDGGIYWKTMAGFTNVDIV